MTNITLNINLEALEIAVNDYFQANEEFQNFLRTWTGGWWPNKTAQEREDYTKHNERTTCKWDTIQTVCKVLNVDLMTLIAIVKANNRYIRNHGRWDRYTSIAQLTHWQKDNLLQIFINSQDSWKGHYKSTGRKDKTVA